ncbi:MAG: hypothetical protein H6684_00880 [Deltaproteobacteria bacterium]|nr:hypothetical protein [Deltaproteobacteria bacterium]MCB9487264.1 hypothetical protein [Deltaproteobacteria bacterium]
MRGFLLILAVILIAVPVTASAQCVEGWSNSAAPLPSPRVAGGSGVYDGKLYVFGGYDNTTSTRKDDTQIYDPATDTWTAGAGMPVPVTDLGFAVAPEGYAYAVAGDDSADSPVYTKKVHEYDIENDTWSTLSFDYPMAFSGVACAAPGDGYVYCFGGTTDVVNASSYAAKYEIGSDAAWSSIEPMPAGKMFGAAAVHNGLIYITGSWPNGTETYAYNPDDGAYTTVDSLNNGRQRPSLVSAGDVLWLTGGGGAWTPVGPDEFYNLINWYLVGTKIGIPVIGAHAGYFPGDGIIVAGGRNRWFNDVPYTQTWQICVPVYDSVTPTAGMVGETMTISGMTFEAALDVALYDAATEAEYPLDNLTVVNDEEITGDVPTGIPSGTYDLVFDGSQGKHVEAKGVFEVLDGDDDDDTTPPDDDDDDTGGCGRSTFLFP